MHRGLVVSSYRYPCMGSAVEHLIALSVSVKGYTATRKGKTYHVGNYFRRPTEMTSQDIADEIEKTKNSLPKRIVTTKDMQARLRLQALEREKAARIRQGKWGSKNDPLQPSDSDGAQSPQPTRFPRTPQRNATTELQRRLQARNNK